MILIALFAFGAVICIHVLFVRLLIKAKASFSPQIWLLYSLCIVNVISVVIVSRSDLLYHLLVLNALTYSYFHLFNMSDTARRIKLLILIHRGKNITNDNYSIESMIEVRLQRLHKMRQIYQDADSYYLRSYFLLGISFLFEGWKKILAR
ncbi:MAG: hypothetical protein HQK52_16635 [Oligoflexia bacterium]|nr:hypothetical protein [Oligoflexia bacterium]